MVRPRAADDPSVEKKLPVTRATSRRSGSPVPVRFAFHEA
jgi:hypothetical protein